jgi:transposase
VYEQKEPKVLVRIVGQAPLAATVYELERLRCNACGRVFTAQEPEDVGSGKYDETAAAMIAQLKYGSGVPFHRLEQMEELLGIPLPAATQWEIVEEAAEVMKPARDELIRQAAQGEVLHNDDTSMRVLRLVREPSDDRTGVFTSNILAITAATQRIALYFTGRQHAGENMADVLKQRAKELPSPIQMCDALSRNTPKAAGAWRSCWPTAWRTEGVSSWRLHRTSPQSAGMCSNRSARSITTMQWRVSSRSLPRIVCICTSSRAGR